MKFLILRFSAIGDIVLTTPVVRCLKKKYPGAEIHYATKKAYTSIVQHNPYITKVHLLKDSLRQLTDELRAEKFDYVIDLHHNQRTWLIKRRLGIKSSSFNKLNFEKWLMVNFKINRLPEMHIVDRYLATCESLGVTNDGQGLDYFIPEEDEVDLKTLPAIFQQGYIGWAIGAKHNTKKFPGAKIIETLKLLQQPVVLLGGKEDEEAANEIIAALPDSPLFNACGSYNLNQSASLVKQATAIISNDTGLMHIAAALKKQVVSIWGSTIPAFGMYPYFGGLSVPNQILEVKELSCRPCSKLGYLQCPNGHFNCMMKIDAAEIKGAAELMGSRP